MFSSRRLERATYDSVAFRLIAANDHPDHDTIATFRRRFLAAIEGLFVQVLMLAREASLLKLGTVALDGIKVHANAGRHSALSYQHACKRAAQLQAEVAALMALAEAAARADVPDGMAVPEGWPGAKTAWPASPRPKRRLRRGPIDRASRNRSSWFEHVPQDPAVFDLYGALVHPGRAGLVAQQPVQAVRYRL